MDTSSPTTGRILRNRSLLIWPGSSQRQEKLNSIDEVMVVFVSRSDTEGQVIVGWYDRATVFRQLQEATKEMHREDYRFLLKTKFKYAVLLPEKYRTHHIPKGEGAFGRASIVYPREREGTLRDFKAGKYSWISNAVSFIESYDGPNVLLNPLGNIEDQVEDMVENEKTKRTGQGFRITPELRRKLKISP